MMKKIIFTSLIFLTFASNANSENCANPQSDYEINTCLGQEEMSVDKELNKVYQKLIKEDPKHKKELTKAELAWIKFRDLECKYQSLSYEGGTLEKQEYSRTFIKLTKERTGHLKHAYEK